MKKIFFLIICVLIPIFLLSSCETMPYTGNPYEHNAEDTEFAVDEGDNIKVYGNYILKLSDDGLHIIHTNNGNMKKTAFLPMDIINLEDKTLNRYLVFLLGVVKSDILIHNNKLVLINVRKEGYETQIEGETIIEYDFFTDVVIYDLTTLTPESFDFAEERQFTFQGAYRTAKIFDNKLYFVSHLLEWDNTKTPYYIEDSQNYEINNNYTLSSEGIAMFSLISLDKKENTKSMAVFGRIAELAFYYNAIYPVFYKDGTSTILKLNINTLAFQGKISDEGYTLQNRYYINDNGSYLFVVSWNSELVSSKLSVYNRENLEHISSIKDIAPQTVLLSVRFTSNYCYLSTNSVEDATVSAYKIDFSNVNNLILIDNFDIGGFSTQLYILEEGSLAVGIGYSTTLRQKISLYDISSGSENMIDSIESYMMIYGHAPRDPRFIFIDKTRKLIILTTVGMNSEDAQNYKEEDDISEKESYQNLMIFEYSRNSLTLKKTFSEKLNGKLFENTENFLDYISARIVAIGDYMYFANNSKITSYNLNDLEKASVIIL